MRYPSQRSLGVPLRLLFHIQLYTTTWKGGRAKFPYGVRPSGLNILFRFLNFPQF